MRARFRFSNNVIAGMLGVALVFVVGYFLLTVNTRLSRLLTHASYDWSFDLTNRCRPDISTTDVVIVYIDEDSLKEFNHSLLVPMNRNFHAGLLERLKDDGAGRSRWILFQ